MQTADGFSCWLVEVGLLDHMQKTPVVCSIQKPHREEVNTADSQLNV